MPVRLDLTITGSTLRAAVADASRRKPVLMSPDGDAIGGRGLEIVTALSTRWGWHTVNWPGFVKCVWAEWDEGIGGNSDHRS